MRNLYAAPLRIEDDDADLDGYARGGVALSRDAAHRAIIALSNDAFALRERGGEANEKAAEENNELALMIGRALAGRYQNAAGTRS